MNSKPKITNSLYLVKETEEQEILKPDFDIFIEDYLDKLEEMRIKNTLPIIKDYDFPIERELLKEEIISEYVYYTNLIYSLFTPNRKKEILKNIYLTIIPDTRHLYYIIDIDCNWTEFVLKNIVKVIDAQYSPTYFSIQWVTILRT